ncbi:flagellar filament capping protein FliD [Gracilibacillus sp. D59]|uniref:flagellar filament capping protein FliD n=1 Tax=Gracilibacillus sp. D59 TaxID=3457434 RepID=UPI003FCEE15B
MAYSVDTSSRITGLATGIDTESLVKQLMAAERKPLDKMTQDLTWKTWQRDAYREVNKLFSELDQKMLDMKLSSAYNTKTVTSSDESLVTATATPGAADVSHTIQSVDALATASHNASTGNISSNSIDPDKSIWTMQNNFNNAFTWTTDTYTQEDIEVTANSQRFKLDKGALESSSLTNIEVIDGNGASTSYNVVAGSTGDLENTTLAADDVFVNVDTGELTFGSVITKGSTIKGQDYDHNVVNFSITTYDTEGNPINDSENNDGDFDFSFDGTASLNDIMDGITSSDAGVSAFYDEVKDVVSLQRQQTGNLNNGNPGMEFSGDFLTSTLNLDQTQETIGQDASFTIDGLSTTRHSNTFTISDVTYTLKGEFTTNNVSIGVQNDVESSFEKIKEFVEKYNEVIEELNGKLQEDRYRDYKPLTEVQKEGMSEREIELWEERAKSGLLKSDSIINNGLWSMRSNWYGVVENESDFNHLTDIGITTSNDYTEGGKLEINETELKKALREDPDGVYKLFSNDVEGSGRGIINRLEDSMENTISRIEERAGKPGSTLQAYTIGRQMDNMEDRISAFEDRLRQVEDRYWRQFTQMEQMIQQMNSQSSYLMQQFA